MVKLDSSAAQRSARDVAAAVILTQPGIDQMQLHKLLYLVQAAHLAWFDAPAFDERIEAWRWGPVVRTVAGLYKNFGDRPIETPVAGDPNALDERVRYVVDRVVAQYGNVPGPDLAGRLKTTGSPWREIRGDLPREANSDREIPLELIERFHRIHGLTLEYLDGSEKRLAQRFLDGDKDALASLVESVTGHSAAVE